MFNTMIICLMFWPLISYVSIKIDFVLFLEITQISVVDNKESFRYTLETK